MQKTSRHWSFFLQKSSKHWSFFLQKNEQALHISQIISNFAISIYTTQRHMESEYLPRIIDNALLEWKDSPMRKPLLVRGARQVGKSCAVRHLAKNFKYFLEINLERNPEAINFFKGKRDVRVIVSQLSDYFDVPVIAGQTLLFLDEIQNSEDAIHSLWFFKEDYPELHVIAAGSLLEFALKNLSTFGVGRVSSLFVYPMSFDEFLMATNNKGLLKAKQGSSPEQPLATPFYDKLVEVFRCFMLVGGMPEAVATYAQTSSFRYSTNVVDEILEGYQDDFAKYSNKANVTLLRQTLISVARQAGTKFVYSRVEGQYRTYEIKNALEMLRDAGLIVPAYHTDANGIPLGAEINDRVVKYLIHDNGVMLSILGIDDNIDEYIKELMVANAIDLVDKGHIAEMMAGLEILKYSSAHKRHQLYYWQNMNKGTCAEVDYVIAKGSDIIPIEVKSGVKGSMYSMYSLMRNPQKHISRGIRCSLENFGTFQSPENKRIDIFPLYAISNLFK